MEPLVFIDALSRHLFVAIFANTPGLQRRCFHVTTSFTLMWAVVFMVMVVISPAIFAVVVLCWRP